MKKPVSAGLSRLLLLLLLLILSAPLIVGRLVRADWAWGWNHLHYAGTAWTTAVFLVGALLLIPRLSRWTEEAFESIGSFLLRGGSRGAAIPALLGLAAFAAFPIATRLYGDSKVIVEDHTPQHLAV